MPALEPKEAAAPRHPSAWELRVATQVKDLGRVSSVQTVVRVCMSGRAGMTGVGVWRVQEKEDAFMWCEHVFVCVCVNMVFVCFFLLLQ